MQDREIPKSHNRHSQAQNRSIGGGSNTRVLSCPPLPQHSTGWGQSSSETRVTGMRFMLCCQTSVLFHC